MIENDFPEKNKYIGEPIQEHPNNPYLQEFVVSNWSQDKIWLDTNPESFEGIVLKPGDYVQQGWPMREYGPVVGIDPKTHDVYIAFGGKAGVSLCENCKTTADFEAQNIFIMKEEDMPRFLREELAKKKVREEGREQKAA